MRWRACLEEQPRFAPRFYAILFLAVLIGLGFLYMGFNVVQMLFWASVLNGLLAPVCILLVVLLTSSEKVMGARASRGFMRFAGRVAFAVTGAAAVALIATTIFET